MKRRTGSKPTAYDKAQIYTLLIGTLGAGANPITTPLPATPATPQQLAATAVSATRIELEWSSTGENTLTFEIESSPDNATWTQIATTNVGQTTYADVDLTAATLYYYRVRAANLTAKSPYSNVASDTTLSLFATVLDNFNRADGNVGANWTIDPTGLNVSSNQCAASVDDWCGEYWNVATFGPDCEAFATIATLPTGNGFVGIEVKYNPVTYVGCTVDYLGSGILQVWGFDGTMLYAGAQTFNAGDGLGIRCIGTTISVYRKPVAGSWTLINSWTDSAPGMAAATGRIELFINKNVARVDDFGGGTI